jgi:hypothetical protein
MVCSRLSRGRDQPSVPRHPEFRSRPAGPIGRIHDDRCHTGRSNRHRAGGFDEPQPGPDVRSPRTVPGSRAWRISRPPSPPTRAHLLVPADAGTEHAVRRPPATLPADETVDALLHARPVTFCEHAGYTRYEISAYAGAGQRMPAQPQLLGIRRLSRTGGRCPRQAHRSARADRRRACSSRGIPRPTCAIPRSVNRDADRAARSCRSNSCSMRCASRRGVPAALFAERTGLAESSTLADARPGARIRACWMPDPEVLRATEQGPALSERPARNVSRRR